MKNIITTDSRRKLNEAEFFHRLMKTAFNEDRLEFEYYLSAFLSSARSVSFVMENEFSDVTEFNKWYKGPPRPFPEKLFQDFNDLRTVTVHHKTIKSGLSSIKIDFGPKGLTGGPGKTVLETTYLANGEIEVTRQDNDGPKEKIDNYSLKKDFVITEYRKDTNRTVEIKGFLEKSREYLLEVNKLVSYCDENFIE